MSGNITSVGAASLEGGKEGMPLYPTSNPTDQKVASALVKKCAKELVVDIWTLYQSLQR